MPNPHVVEPVPDPLVSETMPALDPPVIIPQTLSLLKERFGAIVKADTSDSPLLKLGADVFFKERNGKIKITITNNETGEVKEPVLVTKENLADNFNILMIYCRQERLKNNDALLELLIRSEKHPESCDRVDRAIIEGFKKRPDSIIAAWNQAQTEFGKNNLPPGTISDFRYLMMEINTGDTDESKAQGIANVRKRILSSTAPGSSETIIVNAENMEENRGPLNSVLFQIRVEINPVLQGLIELENTGNLTLFQRAALKGHRESPDDGAVAYKIGEKAFLHELEATKTSPQQHP